MKSLINGCCVLVATVHACQQVEVNKIVNPGRFSIDLYTPALEYMQILFGVSNIFFNELFYLFKLNEAVVFKPGQLTFPCYTGESLWIQAINNDEVSIDKSQIAIDCDNLQLGINVLNIGIYQQAEMKSTTAQVLRYGGGVQYEFLSQLNTEPVNY